jgi:2'-5' RNA ligase
MPHPLLSHAITSQRPFSNKQLAVNEYLLTLQPQEDFYNTIMDLKRQFADTYEHPMAAFLKPNLTLVKFMQFEMEEPRIVQKLQHIAASITPFNVDLDGFGSFPTNTVYINVKINKSIARLVKELKQAQHLVKFDEEHAPHFIADPHIIVAKKLLPWQFEKSWIEYSNTPFNGSFITNNVVLLKRKVGNKSYSMAANFPFLGKEKVRLQQACLFE